MRRILSFAAMMLVCFLCFCQTATSTNPTRTILYTCGTEDEFFCNEYYSNMKVTGNQFACITQNKNTEKLTLILNGNPVVTAKDLWVSWIDLSSKDKCIYQYAEAEKEKYIVIEGQKYGPYEDLGYGTSSCENYWDGTPNLRLLYNKYVFYFERMGNCYRHDNDGSIYEMIPGDFLWEATEADPQYKTKDGLHTARFSENCRRLTVDGKNYVLPIYADAENELQEFYLTDTGDCIIVIYSSFPDKHEYFHFYINKDKQTIEPIQDNEYFDPSSRSLKPKASIPSSIRRQRQMEPSDLNFSLQDKTKRHLFTANWNYEYVMIDDKKLGNHAPINAFYDSDNNAFGWVTIEGRQLVLYSYKL